MITWHDPDKSANKLTPSDRFLQLADEINQWTTDPANLDRMREIRAEAGPKGEDAVSIAIAREVLGGRGGDFALYRDEANLRSPEELAGIMQQYKLVRDKYKLGIGISGINKLDTLKNMSDEDQNAYLWSLAEDAYTAQQQQQKDYQARQDAQLVTGVVGRLQKELGVGPTAAADIGKAIAKVALTRATSPDGSVDRRRYELELKKATDEAIAGANQ